MHRDVFLPRVSAQRVVEKDNENYRQTRYDEPGALRLVQGTALDLHRVHGEAS